MKLITAKEWLQMADPAINIVCGYSQAFFSEEKIKEVQLNAWKKGMFDASRQALEWHPFQGRDNVTLAEDILSSAINTKNIG